ncbi:MAG: hypothetical protein ABIP95_00010, partial [Pelobium sp.]
MKKLIFILLLFGTTTSFAQANFSRFSLGLSGGITNAMTGLRYGIVGSTPGVVTKRTFAINKEKSFGGS